MNRSLSAATGASIDRRALMSELLNGTSFFGASGLVGFDSNGDRNVGVGYDVYNNVGEGHGMVLLGRWLTGNTWSSRFTASSSAGGSLSYVAMDGSSQAPELASDQVVRLGVLCEESHLGTSTRREECDHVLHAIDRLNDKSDGWFDELLPGYTIVTAMSSVGCVEGRAQAGWLMLQESLPGFTAVIGPPCSNDVAAVAGAEWRESSGSRAVVISQTSTAPVLGDEAAYPNVARSLSNDEHMSHAIVEVFASLGWDRVAIVHDDSIWGTGAAASFQSKFAARSAPAH